MNAATIKSFIKFIKQSRYNEFSMKDGEVSLRFRFKPRDEESEASRGIDSLASASQQRETEPSREKKDGEFYKTITSPIVGLFYSTMTSDNIEPIKKGDPVKKNQPLCMIEAMNIEHVISSPYSGIMEETLVDEGMPVMYGQPLFRIRING